MKKYIIVLMLIYSSVSFSQIKVSGKIVNHENNPIDLAEVLLINKDSIANESELTNSNGEFTITIEKGDYLLQIKQFGKKLYTSKIELTHELDLGVIKISQKTEMLADIVVQGKKQIIERKVDRLIFNVENTISANGGDAIDALKITPGVRVQNDAISMIGKNGMAVMVDDRLIQLSGDDLVNFLKTISSENIKSIEVITTPPAKYSAEGNSGLINIKLKKAKKDSWNGALGTSFTQRVYFSKSVLGNFNYNKNKLSLQSSINVGNVNTLNVDNNKTYYEKELWANNNPRKINDKFSSLNAAIDYEITPKWSTGIQYLGSFYKMNIDTDGLATIINNESQQIDSYIKNNGFSTTGPRLNSLNWHNIFKLDTIGTKIAIDLDYFDYKATDESNYRGNHFDNQSIIMPDTYFAGISSNTNNIANFSGKIDFDVPKKWAIMNFGGKVSQSKTKNNASFYYNETGTPILDPKQSNAFDYTENTEALYFSANKEISSKWSAQVGLRAEATQTKGYSINNNQTNENNYIKFFPTAYISYKADEDKILSLNYSRRISRPNYEQLNPFIIRENEYVYIEGNPFLKPSFSDNFELTYGYKKLESKLTFSNKIDGFKQLGIVEASTNIVHYFVLNFINVKEYGISESYVFDKLKWWTSTNSFYFGYSIANSTSAITVAQQKGYQSYFTTNNDFILNADKSFLFSLNYWYSFPGAVSLSHSTASQSLSLSLKYMLLSKKLQLTLTGEDIFKTEIATYTKYSNGIKQEFRNYYDSQMVRLSLKYKFGNKQLKVQERRFGNEEERSRVEN
ncbi:hypothetical protein AR687_18200 [Flavobacteriaceae bacterium CRH]|nr:hypothetical protein AR687_18200 [Flavobacteriaceae bacterium CRH]